MTSRNCGWGIVVGESRCRSYGRARGRDQGRWSGTGGRFDNREARARPGIALRERKSLSCRQRIRFRNDVQHVRRGRIMFARGRARMGAQDKGAPVGGRREQWLSTAAAVTVGVAFFSLWFWLLPGWLGFRVELAGTRRWRWLAAIPSVLGFAVALRCVWDFGWTGRGTPAPVAPPKRLVVVGFYRYVRNPMYLGFAVGWIGLWVVFGTRQPGSDRRGSSRCPRRPPVCHFL